MCFYRVSKLRSLARSVRRSGRSVIVLGITGGEGWMNRVAGKVALVAGAGGGIGGAGAEALAREGAAVLCADIDSGAANATAGRIRAADGRAAALGLDVRDRAAVEAAVEMAVREFGRLDILL